MDGIFMNFTRKFFLAGSIVAALLCAGCITTRAKLLPLDDVSLAQVVSTIQARAETRGVDASVEDLMQLAERNPTSGVPWSAIAKLRFDQKRYGPAIVAADETLQRNPDDDVAKSVRVVSGLRIAQQSLADMRKNAVLSGKAKPDARALAEAIRTTLGEVVLAPPKPNPVIDGRTRPSSPAANTLKPSPATTKPAPPEPNTAGKGTRRNPFEGLLNKLP
jgi:outer membrane murein-binding lipoprotein Lpp